ncbi:MAG: transposase [Kribbellaceae bacterium]|jgi:transposase|nr:transposase [Kribbellaceae bacterium]
MSTMTRENTELQSAVIGGVDTHRDTHTAGVVDTTGRLLDHRAFPATTPGYRDLLAWMRTFGTLLKVGIEGTGAYGNGLANYLTSQNVDLVEVDRPDRKTRRTVGKSDPIDAESAARAALSGHRIGTPKTRTGPVEALRNLRVARRSAINQRADCVRQMKTLIITAPEPLRDQLRSLTTTQLIATCTGLRPDTSHIDHPAQAAKLALRSLARRHEHLSEEITDLDAFITPLIAAIKPDLLDLNGVGPDVAGQLLVTAGENTDRLHSEAAFAMLCGVAPIPASSGQTHRHRLNRGGDRQANAAIYRIVLCRLRHDTRTQAYMNRRTTEGLSKKDIIRCLKRIIAREIYYVLRQSEPTPNQPPTTT